MQDKAGSMLGDKQYNIVAATNTRFPSHIHNVYEVLCVRQGTAYAEIDGQAYTLKTGEKCPVHTPNVGKENPEVTLRRCYGLEMRSLKEYEAKASDPEYGHVYTRLADQEREHCMALLGVIGAIHNR